MKKSQIPGSEFWRLEDGRRCRPSRPGRRRSVWGRVMMMEKEKPKIEKAETGVPAPPYHLGWCEKFQGFLLLNRRAVRSFGVGLGLTVSARRCGHGVNEI